MDPWESLSRTKCAQTSRTNGAQINLANGAQIKCPLYDLIVDLKILNTLLAL